MQFFHLLQGIDLTQTEKDFEGLFKMLEKTLSFGLTGGGLGKEVIMRCMMAARWGLGMIIRLL